MMVMFVVVIAVVTEAAAAIAAPFPVGRHRRLPPPAPAAADAANSVRDTHRPIVPDGMNVERLFVVVAVVAAVVTGGETIPNQSAPQPVGRGPPVQRPGDDALPSCTTTATTNIRTSSSSSTMMVMMIVMLMVLMMVVVMIVPNLPPQPRKGVVLGEEQSVRHHPLHPLHCLHLSFFSRGGGGGRRKGAAIVEEGSIQTFPHHRIRPATTATTDTATAAATDTAATSSTGVTVAAVTVVTGAVIITMRSLPNDTKSPLRQRLSEIRYCCLDFGTLGWWWLQLLLVLLLLLVLMVMPMRAWRLHHCIFIFSCICIFS
mmetsp:Transcript_25193/g.55914  ORF Transcript_25193/g.55914 Transcript_25193/m.55914 type:complete len:316 (+) Transcript_25193:95-1042(+)